MTVRSIALGTLGLVWVVVWSMALVFQGPAVASLIRFATDGSVGLLVNARSAWSLIQLAVAAAMLIPLVVASVGALLGSGRALAVLRVCVAVGGLCSALTVLLYASMVAPIVASGGLPLPFGLRANMEFLSAAVALALQLLVVLIALPPSPRDRRRRVRSLSATSA